MLTIFNIIALILKEIKSIFYTSIITYFKLKKTNLPLAGFHFGTRI